MYGTYLFDCGNVLFGFSREHLLDIFVGKNKKDRELMYNTLFLHWHLQDEGMPSKDFYEMVKKEIPERLWQGVHDIIFRWKEEVWPLPGMWELVKELKDKGKRLILLSNMPETFSYDHDDIEVLKNFEDLMFSYIVGLAKPDPKFFEFAIKKYGLNPSDCLFIDDNEANVNSAKSVGLNTFLFDPSKPEEFIAFVRENEFH